MVLIGTAVPIIGGPTPTATMAATPSSGTINLASTTLLWTGPRKTSSIPQQIGLTRQDLDATCSLPGAYCDDFALTVGIDPPYWTTHTGGVTINITWPNPSDDFDLFVFDANDNIVAQSATSNPSESATVLSASGQYTVRVAYFNTTDAGYSARATLDSADLGGAPPPVTPPAGTPTFQNYVAPPGLGDAAGEPSIGVDYKTGKVMFDSTDASEIPTQTLRVSFDDCSSPSTATWENKPVPTGVTTNDSILFVDHTPAGQPDRCLDAKLIAGTKQALGAYSDDDGDNWTLNPGSGLNSGVDHETIGGGPYHAGGAPSTGSYPHAIYYCAQDSADANCARSDDGGATFGPAVPIYTRDQCTGIHGHVKVAPDGTVYVPNRACHDLTSILGVTPQSGAAVVRSEDNGLTWTLGGLPSGAAGGGSWDPSVGVASDGTLYMGYENGDGKARAAVSHDKGQTWVSDTDIGAPFGIKTSAFPAAVAGDGNRAAIAFLGTSAPGDASDMANFHGSWYLFVATTMDGGHTWTTTNATPTDPVQRGSICTGGTSCTNTPDDRNLLDFIDAAIDAQGRVLVGYADGCIDACVAGTVNSYTAKATIARQSGGKRMFAVDDPPLSTPPGAPALSATKDSLGVVHLTWTRPTDGGSKLLGYHVYRRDPAGTYPATPLATTRSEKLDDDTGGQDFVYEVKAFNAVGEGPACREVASASVPVEAGACQRPGIAVLQDVAGDNLDQQPAHDLRAVAVAEPYLGAGQDKLVITVKVSSLSSVPPDTRWPVTFTGADGKGYMVEMVTDPSGAVSFDYRTVAIDSTGAYGASTVVGPLDPASAFAADGTITLIIDGAKVGSAGAGKKLSKFIIRVAVSAVAQSLTPDNAPNDLVPTGVYTRVGNESCRPNAAPLAALEATPRDGKAPLKVSFDASRSSDADGDAIAQYTFQFGDGTAAVTQKSPVVTHTFRRTGEFSASLKVRDARNFVSTNIAAAAIDTGRDADQETPPTGGSSNSWLVIGAGAVLLLALAGFGLRRRAAHRV